MIKFLQILAAWLLIQCNLALATNSSTAFANVDQFFVQQFNLGNKTLGQNTRPVLVVNGFKYQLLQKDGSTKDFNSLVEPFNELKAVSHIGPAIYAIASAHWREPQNDSWKENLRILQDKIKLALNDVTQVNWANPAWPNDTQKLQNFMRDSLLMAYNFIADTLAKNSLTLQDYQLFSQHYMHTMLATMYLADLANTSAVLEQLKIWKKELGPQWDSLYVLIMGSKGRTTSELTLKTNTAAITIASMLKPENVQSHIIIMPMALQLKEALGTLGAIINSHQLAENTFITPKAKTATGIYKALLTSTVPLAHDNVVHIVDQATLRGHVNLPFFGILPKDREFLTKKR